MKKALFLATALATIAGSAFAADLPSTKAPAYLPPPPPPPMWTGFYVGLNAGYTFSNTNNAAVTGAAFPNLGAEPFAASLYANVPSNRDGFIGGGQIGYNWQFGPSIVIGGEADIQGVAGSGNGGTFATGGVLGSPVTSTFFNVSSRLDYIGTVRGRVGWLFTPTLLLYGTGGLAYGGVSTATGISQPWVAGLGASAFSDTQVGWTAGGGVEWMFWPNWSAKVEYLYYDLGTVSTFNVVSDPTPVAYAAFSTRQRFDGHIVRAGLNYHFNWGSAPVVAKY